MTNERTELSDAVLVARARAGDTGAFGALVTRHQAAALRLAVAISGSPSDAADIAQEALVKAYRSIHRLADAELVRSWLLRIVANEAKNQLRSRDRRRRREERVGSWTMNAPIDPGAAVLDHESARSLAVALGKLPERDREVLAYRYFGALSEREIATAMSVAPGTVKSRTARALERLRKEMAQ